RHCLYGVDRNPLAVELCKVALWIETVEPGKPLSFLDGRIRQGDSLIGVFDLAMRKDLGIDAAPFDPVAELLTEALKEPIDDMPPGRANKIVRRAKRATRDAMTAIADQVIGVQYLAIAYLTVDLTRRDTIVVGPDSAFARAWDLMAEVMGLALAELSLDESAVQAAAQLERCLQAIGFFRAA
ncbi:MAG: hypothetical protein HQL37_13700, partial [Alphaproteobacteria bacterium]|nr:hypothetical protein [Alphaproteobacteria bacterium]